MGSRSKNFLVVAIICVVGVTAGFLTVVVGGSWFGLTARSNSQSLQDLPAQADRDAGDSATVNLAPASGRHGSSEAVGVEASPSRTIADQMELSPEQMLPMIGGGPDGLPGACETGVDAVLGESGISSLTVRCNADEPRFGGMYAQLNASPYRSRRLRLSANLKAENIHDFGRAEGVGAVWMRIDAAGSGPVVVNARERGIRASTDWVWQDVVADIPNDATVISVGFWMQGRGQLWVKDLKLELAEGATLTPHGAAVEPRPPFNMFPRSVNEEFVVFPARFSQEPVDGSWAAKTERQIYDGLVASPLTFSLVDVTCRTTICRIEIVADVSSYRDEGKAYFRQQMAKAANQVIEQNERLTSSTHYSIDSSNFMTSQMYLFRRKSSPVANTYEAEVRSEIRREIEKHWREIDEGRGEAANGRDPVDIFFKGQRIAILTASEHAH